MTGTFYITVNQNDSLCDDPPVACQASGAAKEHIFIMYNIKLTQVSMITQLQLYLPDQVTKWSYL